LGTGIYFGPTFGDLDAPENSRRTLEIANISTADSMFWRYLSTALEDWTVTALEK